VTHTGGTHDVHVALLAGVKRTGESVLEEVPARPLGADLFELLGSPGLTRGCASGDVVTLGSGGRFRVERRGPNHCIQAAKLSPFAESEFAALTDALVPLGCLVEAPADLRFAVVTVPAASGLAAVMAAMDGWASGVTGARWWFGTEDDA
jgi:uncharacterized protein DUF4265